jgi:DNA-binding transcriptional regulator PaaX
MTKQAPTAERSQTKLEMVHALLAKSEGASLATICAATGWQAHSARAALSGLRKAGYTLERSQDPAGSIYRITAAPKVKP